MNHLEVEPGVKIAYRVVGDGPRDVLLVHGWMMSSAVWTDWLASFDTRGVRLIVPDLRGTGGSDKPASGYSLDRYVRDLSALVERESKGGLVIVGHSMGGQIAQALAAALGDRAAGLVLLNSVPAAGLPLPDDAKGLFRNSGGAREMQKTILGLACKQLTDGAREQLLDDAGTIPVACIQGAFDAWTGGGIENVLGSIKARTLVVATDDPFLPPDFLRASVVDKIKGARLAVLPGPGHYPQVERPRETALIVDAFLAGLG
jgi:pimeloyl-ACP methyl ester carboxylesterase